MDSWISQVVGNKKGKPVTEIEIEEWTGIPRNTIKGWSDKPEPIIGGGRGKLKKYDSKEFLAYLTAKAVNSALESAGKILSDAEGLDGFPDFEWGTNYQGLRDYYAAKLHNFKVLQLEGSLLPLDELMAVNAEIIRSAKQKILSIPDQLRADFGDELAEAVDRYLFDILDNFALRNDQPISGADEEGVEA
jgi:hypothetical protein